MRTALRALRWIGLLGVVLMASYIFKHVTWRHRGFPAKCRKRLFSQPSKRFPCRSLSDCLFRPEVFPAFGSHYVKVLINGLECCLLLFRDIPFILAAYTRVPMI